MKTLLPLVWCVFFTATLRAQFYAPEADFHDRAQATFPVEAARVLAWLQNVRGADIVEVTYKLETVEGGDTVWHFQWRNGQKKPIREKDLRDSPALLNEGPKFFREVFGQLVDGVTLPKEEKPKGIDAAYWEGAKLSGVSRLEALAAAGKQVASMPRLEKAADAARIAGTLAHGAMPCLASPQTLDGLLLGRAAAWLCLAERIDGTTDDAAWTPILFLAGREHYARAAWEAGTAVGGADRGEAGRYWNLIVHQPSTTDCFLFGAQQSNRQFAMPAMIYPAEFEMAWMDLLVDVSDEIVGKETMARLFEYGPNVSARGHVGGGHWARRMPGLAMRAWLDMLTSFRPVFRDYTGYQPILKDVAAAAARPGINEPGLISALAPLLNLGLDQGTGPLTPVATVTARDLLVYGWETAGLQYGYTYNSLAYHINDLDGAEEIARPALEQIRGLDVFFQKPKITARYPLEDLRRLQYVGSSVVQNVTLERMPEEWRRPASRYLSRRWLERGGNAGIEAMARGNSVAEEIRPLIERMRHEGGPMAVCNLVNADSGMKFPALIDSLNLRRDLLAEIPWYYGARVRAYESETKERGLKYAMALEKITWNSLACTNHYTIFSNYVVGGAEDSAKRFYDQVRPFITERVGFSNGTGPARYVLAWIEGDEAMERRVLEDSACLSYSDLHLQLVDALLHGKYDVANKVLDTSIERYGNRRDPILKAYLPLIPAVVDAKSPDHARALTSFPDDRKWLFLRWALGKQAGLPAEEIVHLFHDKADGAEGIYAAAALGDKARFRTLYSQVGLDAMDRILISHEFLKQDGRKPPKDQPDLMPTGARPIQELVREELRRQRN